MTIVTIQKIVRFPIITSLRLLNFRNMCYSDKKNIKRNNNKVTSLGLNDENFLKLKLKKSKILSVTVT